MAYTFSTPAAPSGSLFEIEVDGVGSLWRGKALALVALAVMLRSTSRRPGLLGSVLEDEEEEGGGGSGGREGVGSV